MACHRIVHARGCDKIEKLLYCTVQVDPTNEWKYSTDTSWRTHDTNKSATEVHTFYLTLTVTKQKLTMSTEDEKKADGPEGCYLLYESDSGGKLTLLYTHGEVPDNAVGFLAPGPGKTIPNFKVRVFSRGETCCFITRSADTLLHAYSLSRMGVVVS